MGHQSQKSHWLGHISQKSQLIGIATTKNSSGEDDVSVTFFVFYWNHTFSCCIENILDHILLKTYFFIFYEHNEYVLIYNICTHIYISTYIYNIGMYILSDASEDPSEIFLGRNSGYFFWDKKMWIKFQWPPQKHNTSRFENRL